MFDDWISTDEASRISGYHPNHIRRLIRGGKILARKWGSAWMISRESVLDYIDQMASSGERRGPKGEIEESAES